ncbi:MAG: Maf family protein [Chloroflexi bacterium]|nr:Maf family protein [Chloroflexota bacterium]
MQNRRPLILASQSPRRRELMTIAGYTFNTITADIDETPLPDEAPGDYTLRMGRMKALAVNNHVPYNALIITSDTTVAYGDELLGKPGDSAEAMATLQKLRGKQHQVYSSITILAKATGEIVQDLAITNLQMRDYTDEEIQDYIDSGDPFDKAGSYAIQHKDFSPVARLEGCYANVMGLPLCHLTRTLRKFGIESTHDVPLACQNANDIVCPVFDEILRK